MIERTLFIPCRVFTTNEERKRSPYWRAQRVKELRERSCELVQDESWPALTTASFEITPHLKVVRQDTGGCFPVVKAVIDGVVDAGVLEDDGPKIVRQLTFNAGVKAEVEGIEITIRGEPQ